MKYFNELFSNEIIGISILSWFIAQVIKIIIDLVKTKSLDFELIVSSGGMPSSHSSFVTALFTNVGLREGFDSPLCAICFVLSMVVMYDAAGVRRAAGKQAKVLNQILADFEHKNYKVDEKLKELLGHTPIEVAAGALLGIIVACVCYF